MAPRALAFLIGTLAIAVPAAAQRAGRVVQTLDADVIGIAQRGFGATITPAIQRDTRRLTVGAAATGTFAESAHLFYEGTLLGEWRALRVGPATLGIGGATSAGGYRNLQHLDGEQLYVEGSRGRTFSNTSVHFRADAGREGLGAWLVAGSPSLFELTSRRPLHAELGVVAELGSALLYSSASHDGLDRRGLFEAQLAVQPARNTTQTASLDGAEPGSYYLRMTTALVGAQWVRGKAELSGEVARRILHGTPVLVGTPAPVAEHWGRVTAAWQVTPRLSLRASYGAYPYDFLRDIPGAEYVTLGARLQRGSRSPIDYYRPPSLPPFRIDTIAGGARSIRLRAPRAQRVELSADFTDWTPVPMRKGPHGEWELVLPVPPGTYRLSIRVDGGEWRAPPGLVAVEDEFAGEVAVVVLR